MSSFELFSKLAPIVASFRELAANTSEPTEVREMARDFVRLAEHDREAVIDRLVAIATNTARAPADRRRAIALLITVVF